MSTIYCLSRSQHYISIGLGTHNETFYDTMQYISASADRTITSASVSAHTTKHFMTRCNIFQHQQIVPLRRHRSQQPAEQLPVSTSCHQVASASDLRPAPDDPHCDTHTERHSNIYIQTKDCHQLIDSSSSAVWRR